MKFQFADFRDAIAAGAGPNDPRCIVGSDDRFTLVYAPFSYVTRTARLAIVGQTPGPDQLALAYPVVRSKLAMGWSEDDILRVALDGAAFGGDMRDPLLKMLRHFGIGDLIGVADVADLWKPSHAHLLHATSVVPHAAFRKKSGKRFSDSDFQVILKSPAMQRCFETCFLPQLAELPSDCLFIGLGPLVHKALKWCVEHRHIKAGQLLGGLPHPSRASGNQVSFFLGEIAFDNLTDGNPVKKSAARLTRDYAEFLAKVAAWRAATIPSAA